MRVGGGRDKGRDRETQGYGGKKRKKWKKEEKKVQISPTFNLNWLTFANLMFQIIF